MEYCLGSTLNLVEGAILLLLLCFFLFLLFFICYYQYQHNHLVFTTSTTNRPHTTTHPSTTHLSFNKPLPPILPLNHHSSELPTYSPSYHPLIPNLSTHPQLTPLSTHPSPIQPPIYSPS